MVSLIYERARQPHCAARRSLAARLGLAASIVAETLTQWRLRANTRRHLAGLDRRLLRDVGLDRATAAHEADKPFWR